MTTKPLGVTEARAERTSLNASVVRYYEKRGLLMAPYRTGGQRRYSDDMVHRVLLIRFASDMGFTLGEIKLFFSGLRTRPRLEVAETSLAKLS